MTLFSRTEDQVASLSYFADKVGAVVMNLEGAASEPDLQAIRRLGITFRLKTEDFFRENRKLNIGVVGQVKAGKSSFLNTLLFGGAEVLPKASTPKTATLTKMEYAEHNRIHIEYYSPEEWEVLADNATVESDEEIYQTAKEIVGMVNRSGVRPQPLLERGCEERDFASYEDLIANLNDYVGEDGRFTPLVKAVTLYMNKPEFKEISIVDTPGLNDPVASRTIRTKEFMEVCDVVFFLSQTGSFLDQSDWTLLSSQLPQKGVKKLVLVASKFDSGLRDVLRHRVSGDPFDDGEDDNSAATIPAASQIIERKLKRRARDKVAEFVADLQRRGGSAELISVIEQCKEPLLISATAFNMSNKHPEQYTAEEQNVYRALKLFSADLAAELKQIGNIDRIQRLFETVVAEKEEILAQKARSFVPTAIEELRQTLADIREKAEKKLALLSGSDREQLLEQKRTMEKQISGIKADITAIFVEQNTRLEEEKIEAVRDLRNAGLEYSKISERTGTRTETGNRSVSTSKWYNPFSWGSKRRETYTYEVSYSYMAVSDALDSLRSFATEATNNVEAVFAEALHQKEMRRKLLAVVANHFDLGSHKHDVSLFRLLVEQGINKIEFPVFKLDVSETVKKLSSSFSAQVTSARDKANLNEALSNAVDVIYGSICDQFVVEVRAFKGGMDQIGGQLSASLISSVNAEFDEVLVKFADRERQIAVYRDLLVRLNEEIAKM